MEGLHHRFAVILAADCAEYCRKAEENAEQAVAALKRCRDAFERCVIAHRGREFGCVGDSLMAEFLSPIEALRAARDFQAYNHSRQSTDASANTLQFRMGLHEGDVLAENGDLYGDVVNIAARLQELAAPGGIVVSSLVHAQVHKESGLFFRPLGRHVMKNIAEPIVAYDVQLKSSRINWRRIGFKLQEYRPAILAALVVTVGMIGITLYEGAHTPVSKPIPVDSDVPWPVVENSIAVLPFRDLGPATEDNYFVEGISDDVLMQLAKLSSFHTVISRTSVEQYRDTAKSVPQIGKELRVEYIVEGSVQQVGDQVRINIQLLEAATGKQLLGKSYDRKLTIENVFLVQEDVARDVARTLRLTVTPHEDESLAKVPTNSLEAYRLYHLGVLQVDKATVESVESAISLFKNAIRADPEFAQAYARLSLAYIYQYWGAGTDGQDAFEKARLMGTKAIELDPELADGHVALGLVYGFGQRKQQSARDSFDKAIELSPRLAWAREAYGNTLLFFGQPDEAIVQLEVATRLSPREVLPYVHLGRGYAWSGQYEEALAAIEYAKDLAPDFAFVYQVLGDTYGLLMGRLDEAIRSYSEGMRRDPENIRWAPFIVAFLLDLGDTAGAQRLLGEIDPDVNAPVSAKDLQIALLVQDGKYDEAKKEAEAVWLNRKGGFVAHILQQLYMLEGRFDTALEINDEQVHRFEEFSPHPEVEVSPWTLNVAINRAAILLGIGERRRAELLLRDCLKLSDTVPRWFFLRDNFTRVQAYALIGDVPNALSALRQSIKAGSRSGWRIDLLHSPITAVLRSEPQFQELVDEVRSDMAAQLKTVREMQRRGEILQIPPINHQELKRE